MSTTNGLRNLPPPTRPPPTARGSEGEYISINDNLLTSSQSGKTVLKVFACVLGLIVLSVLYGKTIGF